MKKPTEKPGINPYRKGQQKAGLVASFLAKRRFMRDHGHKPCCEVAWNHHESRMWTRVFARHMFK